MKPIIFVIVGIAIGAVAGSGPRFFAAEPTATEVPTQRKEAVMAQPVVHFEIAGKDGNKTREFYGKLFGWQYQMMEEMDYGMVQPAGEGSIGGGVTGAMGGAPPYITFYVQVDDLAKYLKSAEAMGAKTVVPPTPIPNVGSMAMFADPDGNVVGLYKHGE